MAAPALRLLFPTEAAPADEVPVSPVPTSQASPRPAPEARETPETSEPTPLYALFEPGRLVELSAVAEGPSARTSTAVALLRKVQREGETTAWIQLEGGSLHPPDLHEAGVDLEALVVIHVPPADGAAGLGRAAELLLRSEAFGLVILDLGTLPGRTAWHGRLLGLARQHESRVLLLTDKPSHAPSLGPLVGLRIEPRRASLPGGGFDVEHHVLKNKSGAPVTPATARFVGPPGLR